MEQENESRTVSVSAITQISSKLTVISLKKGKHRLFSQELCSVLFPLALILITVIGV